MAKHEKMKASFVSRPLLVPLPVTPTAAAVSLWMTSPFLAAAAAAADASWANIDQRLARPALERLSSRCNLNIAGGDRAATVSSVGPALAST